MHLTETRLIDAPPAAVWQAATDLGALEQVAAARKIPLRALRQPAALVPGMIWEARPAWRGLVLPARGQIETARAPDHLALRVTAGGLLGRLTLRLSEPEPGRTHLRADLILTAESAAGMVLLASGGLARARLAERLARGLDWLEARVQNGPPAA